MNRDRPPDGRDSLPQWLRTADGFVTVEVAARPGSPRRGILRVGEHGLVIGLGSPAEKGKANQELVEFIATLAGVTRAAVTIVQGTGGRRKVARIAASDVTRVAQRLLAAGPSRNQAA